MLFLNNHTHSNSKAVIKWRLLAERVLHTVFRSFFGDGTIVSNISGLDAQEGCYLSPISYLPK